MRLAERRDVEQAMGELGGSAALERNHRLFSTTRPCDDVCRRKRFSNVIATDTSTESTKFCMSLGLVRSLAFTERAKTGEVFAVKVLRKRFRDEAKELEQFLREGQVGLKLRHPNIVSIFEVVPDKRNPFSGHGIC